jgi:predicted secreted protein
MYKKLLTATLLLSFSLPYAFADETQNAKPQPQDGTYLNLSVTERTEAQEDILVASLSVEKEGTDPKQVQNDINKLALQAVTKAKVLSDITVKTEQYYVYKSNPKANSNAKIWHGAQRIQFQSTSTEVLLKLVGDLQSLGLLVQGLHYSISPERIDQLRDAMIEKAIVKLMKKAERVGHALNKKQVKLIDINIGENYMPDFLRPMMMANSKDVNTEVSNPVAEPGKREVTITISAKALLQ